MINNGNRLIFLLFSLSTVGPKIAVIENIVLDFVYVKRYGRSLMPKWAGFRAQCSDNLTKNATLVLVICCLNRMVIAFTPK